MIRQRSDPFYLAKSGCRLLFMHSNHSCMCTLCLKKRHPFYFCDIFVQFHPILIILAETCPRKFETNTCTCPIHISFYMFVLYLVKTGDVSERIQRRRPLLVRPVIEPECRTLFKSLFKLLTLQPLSKNSRINLLPPKNSFIMCMYWMYLVFFLLVTCKWH